MRVGFLSSEFSPHDGWGRYSRELVRACRDAGVSPIVVTCASAPMADLDLPDVHAVLPPLPLGSAAAFGQLVAAPRVRQVLSTCDVVHLLVEPYLPLAALATPRGLPLVMTAHGTYAVRPFARAGTRWLYARAMPRIDLLVCQSAWTRDAVAARVGLPPHVVLPGGVRVRDVEPPGPDGSARRAARGDVPAGAHVVLTVGAVKRRKGHDQALAALGRAASVVGGLHWVVVGDTGADRAWFGEVARRSRSTAGLRVHWCGRVDEDTLAGWYERASLFLLLPSAAGDTFEGFGLVFLEAAARGVPSITWTGSGAAEAVLDGCTGLVVEQGDVDAAGAAVARLLVDPLEHRRMGEAARAFSRARSWTALARALLQHYDALRTDGHLGTGTTAGHGGGR